jgi:deoxycytidylate deaminase
MAQQEDRDSERTSERRPELFIGLVAAIGTDHSLLSQVLEETLRSFNYKTKLIRLTSLLREIPRFRNIPVEPVDDYIAKHQQAGDEFRELVGGANAMAALGIKGIREAREKETRDPAKVAFGTAYIIRSLKTPAEVQLLREVYGDAFLLIASSAPYLNRRNHLATKIAQSRHEFRPEPFLADAERLIQVDLEEPEKPFGQNLKDTFHRADVFLDMSDSKLLRASIERAMELVFGNTLHTPNRDEYAMFQATGARLRSSELGRQVGAAIATSDGDIVAVGTNEVPRAGGGLYWSGDEPDFREFVKGEDSSDLMKRSLIEDLLNRLKEDGLLHPDKKQIPTSDLARMALDPTLSKKFCSAHVTDLIEFGRAVHAEMAAITDAARRGVAISGTTLYVTTFPCHLCARMIVAAGIIRVIFIEPYTKSLALQLYPDSISADYVEGGNNKIRMEPFVGIAPRMYMELFSMRKRKSADGKVIEFQRQIAIPRLYGSPRSYLASEKLALDQLGEAMRAKHLMDEQQELPNVRTGSPQGIPG